MTVASRQRIVEPDGDSGSTLADVLVELRLIRALLEQREAGPSLSRADRARLVRLLPALAGAFGSEPVLASEVIEHEAEALRAVCEGLTVKQLGRLLRRSAGTAVGGYVIERLGDEAGAAIWQVLQVPDFPGLQKSSVPRVTFGAARESSAGVTHR